MNRSLQNSPSLITWRLIETKMCWGVIFLLGGGFALASASQSSGLSALLVHQLEKLNLSSLPNWLVSTGLPSKDKTSEVTLQILFCLFSTIVVPWNLILLKFFAKSFSTPVQVYIKDPELIKA